MFKLDRLLMIVVVTLLNLCSVSSELSDFLDLLKLVETRINCVETITKTGHYVYEADPSASQTRCMISVVVPEEAVAFVRPTERTCETTSSANISSVCDRPNHEERFITGEHHFRFDASESVTITVNVSPIIRLGCNEYFKNLHTLLGSVVVFENNENDPLCMLQLPPALEVHYLDFQSPGRKKCCPDIFVASTDLAENPIAYSDSLSACDIPTKRLSAVSRCESTYLYMRGSSKGDQIMFRVRARSLEYTDDCLPIKNVIEPEQWICRPKSKRRNRLRTKQSF